MRNDSKVSAKKAIPGGAKRDVSFSKRSGAQKAEGARRSRSGDEDYGPRTAGRIGAKVGDDGAGTKFTAGLPPETEAMAAPAAVLPAAVKDAASPTLPVPSADQGPINAAWGWDYERDNKLGKRSER